MPFSAQLQALFEHSIDGILLTVPDGQILAANPAACQLLGRTEAEICTLGRNQIVDTSDARFRAQVDERAQTGRLLDEMTMIRSDGTRFPVEVSSVIYESAALEQRAFVIFRDVSERRRAEAEQRAAIENLRAMIESSPLAIQGIDPDRGTVLIWNEASTRLFGWAADEVIGRPSPLVSPEYAAEQAALRLRVMAGETLTGVELVRRRKDGSPVEVSLSTSAIRAFDGRVTTHLALYEDIASRKAAERERIVSEQVVALQQLALGIRHHMNNALAAARLELEVGMVSTALPSSVSEGLTALQQHLSRMTAIVRRLDRVEELEAVPYLGQTMMLDVSADA